MTYDYREKKCVIVLLDGIEMGVALNVVGHLAISVGRYAGVDLMGRHLLKDASGIDHRGISRYPVIVTKAKNQSQLRQAILAGRENKNIFLADYPREMLTTGHDDELAAALEKAQEQGIEYLGAAVYGTTEEVNTICKKFSLWR